MLLLLEKSCNMDSNVLPSLINNAMSHKSVITCVIALLVGYSKIVLFPFYGSIFPNIGYGVIIELIIENTRPFQLIKTNTFFC